ncbi:MAG: HAD family hydrolase [Lachnospiraceae bacterium]
MKDTVIFDLDGTLLDTLTSIAEAANHTLRDLGLPVHEHRAYCYMVGDGPDILVKRFLTAAGDQNASLYPQARAIYQQYFEQTCLHCAPYDGITELIDTLSNRQLRLAVLSNKQHAQTVDIIQTVFGKERFACIRGQQPGFPIKPDPAGVHEICKVLEVTPEECIYVGDTNVDMQTGHAAGMFTIGVTWGFRTEEELREYHADAIIHHPLELLEYFDECG